MIVFEEKREGGLLSSAELLTAADFRGVRNVSSMNFTTISAFGIAIFV